MLGAPTTSLTRPRRHLLSHNCSRTTSRQTSPQPMATSSAGDRDSLLSKLLALPQPTFHSIIAAVLTRAIDANDALPTKGVITRFHAKVPCKLGIVDYLTR